MSLSLSVRVKLSSIFALDVTMTASSGITVLFGPSGSGKSTLLRSVAGLVRPDAGSIAIGNRILFDASSGHDLPVRQRRVGYVFQQLALFPHMSIGDNLAYGLRDRPSGVRREQTCTIAESFRIQHVLSRRPDAISGGERLSVLEHGLDVVVSLDADADQALAALEQSYPADRTVYAADQRLELGNGAVLDVYSDGSAVVTTGEGSIELLRSGPTTSAATPARSDQSRSR